MAKHPDVPKDYDRVGYVKELRSCLSSMCDLMERTGFFDKSGRSAVDTPQFKRARACLTHRKE